VLYKPIENVTLFLTYSTGYKAGGFDNLVQGSANAPFQPEEVESYEFGARGKFFDDKLNVSLSVYNTDYVNQQVLRNVLLTGGVAGTWLTLNRDAVFRGVELTFDAAPIENLRVGGTTAFSEIEITRNEIVQSGKVVLDPTQFDASSFPLKYSVLADYSITLKFGIVDLHADYVFQEAKDGPSTAYSNLTGRSVPGTGVDRRSLNLRAGYEMQNGLTITAWGSNVTDERWVTGITGSTELDALVARVNQPASYGIDLRYRF
jgi:iron complex outermembrane receptor protein